MKKYMVFLGVLTLIGYAVVVAYALRSSDDYAIRGDALTPGFRNLSSVAYQNASSLRYKTAGSFGVQPAGEMTVSGHFAVATPTEATTLRVVFEPPDGTTLIMKQGDAYARNPSSPYPLSYLLWTK